MTRTRWQGWTLLCGLAVIILLLLPFAYIGARVLMVML